MTFEASTRSSGTTVVDACRTSRASRTWRSGRRSAWARAVAGTVTSALRSAAPAKRTITRRSPPSRAMRARGSRVTPAIRHRPDLASARPQDLVGPDGLVPGERPAGFPEGLGQPGAPPVLAVRGQVPRRAVGLCGHRRVD